MAYHFRNDYSFGAHPKVLKALCQTNLEGNPGYGADSHCAAAAGMLKELCRAPDAAVTFFIGGTSVNFTAVAALLRPWEGVFCAGCGHINTHEAGAVEATGHKVLALPAGPDGKLSLEELARALPLYGDVHLVRPGMVYLSDATETGGVYTLAELESIARLCREHRMYLFVDGARLGCALTARGSDVTLPDLARLCDAFTVGGTKNGALMGEALVLANPALHEDFFRIQKQRGGVLAKGWLIGAQFEALLSGGLYFDLARHANEMAQRLQEGLVRKGVPFLFPSPTNQIFPIVRDEDLPGLQALCPLEVWGPAEEPGHTIVRLVACFATAPEEVDGLISAFPAP